MSDIIEKEEKEDNDINKNMINDFVELTTNKIRFFLKRKTSVIVLNPDKTFDITTKKQIPHFFKYKDNYHLVRANEIYTGKKKNIIIYSQPDILPLTAEHNPNDEVYQILLHTKITKDWLNEVKEDFTMYLAMIGVGVLIGAMITAIVLKAKL